MTSGPLLGARAGRTFFRAPARGYCASAKSYDILHNLVTIVLSGAFPLRHSS